MRLGDGVVTVGVSEDERKKLRSKLLRFKILNKMCKRNFYLKKPFKNSIHEKPLQFELKRETFEKTVEYFTKAEKI